MTTLFDFYLEQAEGNRERAEAYLRGAIEDDLPSYIHFINEFCAYLSERELKAGWEWIEGRRKEVVEELAAAYTEEIIGRGVAEDGSAFALWRSHHYYFETGRFASTATVRVSPAVSEAA